MAITSTVVFLKLVTSLKNELVLKLILENIKNVNAVANNTKIIKNHMFCIIHIASCD